MPNRQTCDYWRMRRYMVGKETVLCEVRVFLFRVERQLDDWPEKRERETKWFEAKKPQV